MSRDLSVMGAIDRAAAAAADYGALCMETTFPDMFPAGTYHSRWEGQPEGAREMSRRNILVGVFAYLWFRSSRDPALEIERQLLLKEVDPRWVETLAKVLGITQPDARAERKSRHAFGAPLSDPRNGLRLLVWDQGVAANLLVDTYAREETRRLEEKASLMKAGSFDAMAQDADSRWAARNSELLEAAQRRSDLAGEAQASLDLLAPAIGEVNR